MRTCSVEGCSRQHNAKGLCKSHYETHRVSRSPELRAKRAAEKRSYYAKTREVVRSIRKREYRQDPTPQRVRSRAYYAANRETVNERRRTAWQAMGPAERDRMSLAILDSKYRRWFGISLNDAAAMLDRQSGACAICQSPLLPLSSKNKRGPSAPVVDHCHRTGRVRGILCNHCNRGLGLFRDEAQHLAAAARYLSA